MFLELIYLISTGNKYKTAPFIHLYYFCIYLFQFIFKSSLFFASSLFFPSSTFKLPAGADT